jgi:lipopolysaccharide/colanic/teichoic acid biosynthesis glycosyltransferase
LPAFRRFRIGSLSGLLQNAVFRRTGFRRPLRLHPLEFNCMPFVVRRAKELHKPLHARSAEHPGGEAVKPAAYLRGVALLSRIGAAILAIPGLPITVALVMLVQMTSRGPGIYRQRRVGKNGKVFTLYKIRTMRVDAEAKTGPVWTAPNDPRITKVGRLLRPTHLDELPQLINVLRGEMTLIGPRPERPEFTQHLACQVPGYMDRFSVLPGITGLAQINLPPDTDVDSVRRKLVLDLEYIRGAHFKLDARIFMSTLMRLFGLPARRCARWFSVDRSPTIPDHFYHSGTLEAGPTTYHESAEEESGSADGASRGPVPSERLLARERTGVSTA